MSYLKHKPGSIEEMMANNAKKLNDNAYQQMFKKELDKAGKGIGSMSPKEKKDFFNKIDSKYKAKDEGFASDAQRKAAFASGYKEKGDKKEELSSAQKKLPDALKKVIMKKMSGKDEQAVPPGSHKMPDGTIMKDKDHKKEDLNKDDEKVVNKVKDMLKGASAKHAAQAKMLDKAMKTEADQHGDEINDKKVKASMTKGDKKPQKLTADSGSKLTKVETEPKVDYKN